MPSPFPGMYPHLENPSTWPDWLSSLISHAGEEFAYTFKA
jgi:hypothetical protein